jgi:chromosome partitioning protein
MRRIAVINQKGGVGKTTTTANLGAALAKNGLRVLLIDLDPQGHLTLHFGAELRDGQPSVYDVLTAATPVGDVLVKVRDRMTLVPADIDLAGAEVELISVTGREVILREALDPIEQDYDIMLIDSPPSLGVLTVNALVASTEVLIPLQAHFFALQGLSKLLDTVTLVRQRINPQLHVGGVVLCMYESATRLAGEVVDDLVKFLEASRGTTCAWADARVYQTSIRRNIKLAESCSFGQTVFEYAPRSHGAIDYARLAAEVLGETISTEGVGTPNAVAVSAPSASALAAAAPTPLRVGVG